MTTTLTAGPAQAATHTSRRRQMAVLVIALAFVMDLMDATLSRRIAPAAYQPTL
jgi:hypothetical protein